MMGDAVEKAVVKVPFTTPVEQFEEETFTPRKFPQFLATFISTLGAFSLGCALAWTSPALPDLEQSQDFGTLTSTETSWITSLTILGALISGPVAGFLINVFGRRKAMVIMSFFFTCGWLCIGFAKNVEMMYIGRFITGLTGGTFLTTIPIFVSEIAETKLRGTLGSAMVLMIVSGILFAYTVGAFVSWWQLALLSATTPLFCFLGLIFIPESPRYLLTMGKWNGAAAALRWFRGAKNLQQINPELFLLKHAVDADEKKSCGSLLKLSNLKQILDPCTLKPLGVTVVLMIFQQTSGINAIQSYTVKIFQSASPHIDPNLATIIIGIVQVTFVFLSMLLVDRLGRKFLLILSFAIMAVSLGTLATFFQVKPSDDISHQLTWVPLVALILFVVAYSFGLGPLPWVIFGEIISPKAKGFAAAIITSVYWIVAFICTKTFEDVAAFLGWNGYYWHVTVICIMGGLFTIFFIPETKGKSQREIQEHFGGNKERRKLSEESEKFDPSSDSSSSVRIEIDNNFKKSGR